MANRRGGKQYDDNMRGVLFRNDTKGNDKAPIMRGEATIDGVKLRVSAWSHDHDKMGKFLKLQFEPWDAQGGRKQQPEQRPAPASKPAAKPDFDDDLPW